jgi:hypothetical protein
MGERVSRESERRLAERDAVAVASARPDPAAGLLPLLAGNQATVAVVSRLRAGSVQAPTLQRLKANAALNTISKLIQNVKAVGPIGEASDLLNVRDQIERTKAEAGPDGGNRDITGAQEQTLTRIENFLINNAPAGFDMAGQIAGTDTARTRDARTIVDAGGGTAADLALGMLVAKLNRNRKMDIEIAGGTTQAAVRAAALADGYRLFQHVTWTATPDAIDPDQYTITLSNPNHPFAAEFDASIRLHVGAAGFPPIQGYTDVVVYTDAGPHTPAALNQALASWHPGIASDKTQSGEFREDPPHPQVANAVHSTRAHTHLQAPGCYQTTILY